MIRDAIERKAPSMMQAIRIKLFDVCHILSKTIIAEPLRVGISAWCLLYGWISGLPGIRFDIFGRKLAFRSLLSRYRKSFMNMLLNPVSFTRYYELSFAERFLNGIHGTLLDVSSPRLLPLMLASRGRFRVTMINPDGSDLDESKGLSRYLSKRIRIRFDDGVDARRLPYQDNSFDALTCISVIEHIPEKGDMAAMEEFVRVVRPGGRIILTFPVRGKYYEEFRLVREYNVKDESNDAGQYFFQRFYDEDTIRTRIFGNLPVKVLSRQYYFETYPGWHDRYMRNWMHHGIKTTIWDPSLLPRYFKGPVTDHPKDRVGNCHICLEVVGKEDICDIAQRVADGGREKEDARGESTVKKYAGKIAMLYRQRRFLDYEIARVSTKIRYYLPRTASDFVNKCEICVLALKRSGHHPIINWIGRQYPGKRVIFLNSPQPHTNPFVTCEGEACGYAHRLIFHHFQVDRKQEGRGNHLNKDCLIYNFEDEPSGLIFDRAFDKNMEDWLGKSERRLSVLVLRDPFNFFASRLARERKGLAAKEKTLDHDLNAIICLWKEQAKEYLGETGFIPNKVAISYNRWFLDRDYRRVIADALGISFTDKGLQHVPDIGAGSSFDGQGFQNRAQQMKVLERWREFVNDELYRSIFKDKELVNYSDRIFGRIPGTEAVCQR